jgi:NDP-sugar pyrophosphorylase family protein
MDVRAILVVIGGEAQRFAGRPLGLLDVLGQPLVERVAARLRNFGAEQITIISESEPFAPRFGYPDGIAALNWQHVSNEGLWRACEQVFNDYAHDGAEIILVWRLGAYAEINLEDLVQFHLDSKNRVTPAMDENGWLGIFAISASRRNDAAFLFRHQLEKCRTECQEFRFPGYRNGLASVGDFRRLVRDALFCDNTIMPAGKEIRPGIWAGPGARIEKGARIVAPAYLGARSRVRAAAVITRASSVERYAEVDCGTVVEDSTVLPFTCLGAGLDLAQSVAGFGSIAHLRRNVEVEIVDSRLLAMRPVSPARRAVGNLASMAGVLLRSLPTVLSPSPSEEGAGAPTLNPEESKDSAVGQAVFAREHERDFVMARRYGNR